MLLRLFLLFTLVPIAELAILIQIGGLIGLGPTLGLVIGTGAAGAWLARREGLRSWRAVQSELAQGRLPAEELVHGLLVLLAGVVLLTPGVLTDLLGLALLVRPLRRRLMARLRSRFMERIEAGEITVVGGAMGPGASWGFAARPAPGARGPRPGTPDPGRVGERPRGREIVVEEDAPLEP